MKQRICAYEYYKQIMQETENNMYKKHHSTMKPTKIICLLCPITNHSQHWLGPPMTQ
jgi:hypothetical protein